MPIRKRARGREGYEQPAVLRIEDSGSRDSDISPWLRRAGADALCRLQRVRMTARAVSSRIEQRQRRKVELARHRRSNISTRWREPEACEIDKLHHVVRQREAARLDWIPQRRRVHVRGRAAAL